MIAAIVVTYNPDRDGLIELLQALVPQVDIMFIVDNSPRCRDLVFTYITGSGVDIEKIRISRIGHNLGIGAALNIGIKAAIAEGATWLVMSDQDSLPAPDMVAQLLRTHEQLTRRGEKAGVVGPTYTDLHTGITYPFQVILPSGAYKHGLPSEDTPCVESLTIITSGSLVSAATLADVGEMHEGLFIDYVDIEWCHRARSLGYKHFGVHAATMYQRLGDSFLSVWLFGWRRESGYNAIRIYYRSRNFMLLCRANYIPSRWKIRGAWNLLGFGYSQIVYGAERWLKLNMFFRGIVHGIKGRMGPLS